ncbi:MAG: metallophosphoesterase family protein [Bacteroidales bacterium]|nr:metallophosphoesterase family protein [Bacteroidales bacterium]
MYRKIAATACAIALSLSAMAQQKPQLKFRDDGTFTIVQITDTHYKWGNGASDKAVECIEKVCDMVEPDLVVFTGDQVYALGANDALLAMTAPLNERGIPYASIFGNHDRDFGTHYKGYCENLAEQYDVMEAGEYSVMPPRDANVCSPDYVVPVFASDGRSMRRLLWLMDTHDATYANAEGIKGYDWLLPEQIDWYRAERERFTQANGGTLLPGLLFIHIPLPQYMEAFEAKAPLYGSCKEKKKVCCSAKDSGMFAAMQEQGDIRGVFAGHDHDNDFATAWNGVLLAYGRYSGGNTVYNHLGTNGARVIQLDENSPSLIHTWIQLSNGKVEQDHLFPADF